MFVASGVKARVPVPIVSSALPQMPCVSRRSQTIYEIMNDNHKIDKGCGVVSFFFNFL